MGPQEVKTCPSRVGALDAHPMSEPARHCCQPNSPEVSNFPPEIDRPADTCLAQTTAFTYQGKLSSGGAPASGDYQFEFKLFDSDLAGNQTNATQTVVASVQNGIFTTRLDFGAAQQLTFGAFDDHYPAWRSDGQKIAFVRNLSGQVRIWMGSSQIPVKPKM